MSELILPHKPISTSAFFDSYSCDSLPPRGTVRMRAATWSPGIPQLTQSLYRTNGHHSPRTIFSSKAELNAGMRAVQGYLQTSVSRTARPQHRNQQKQEKDWEATPSYIDKSQYSLPRLSVSEQWARRSHRPIIYSSSVERLSVDAPWDVFNQSIFHTLGNFHDSMSHARSNPEFDNEMESSCQAPQKVLPATEIASGP
ncbi:hypothetical protein DFH09DRAFT_1110071 [Mycena vulgaris]|nr:hypothetical protein DFH09DRAFT_1110071 [Mycena vulgaris]